MFENIPKNWKIFSLNDLATIITGNTPPKNHSEYYETDDILWVKPSDLSQWNPWLWETEEKLSESARKVIRILPVNSVLVSCIGTIGKIGIAPVELATNQQINSVIFNDKIINFKYGYYAFKYYKDRLENLASNAVVPIINKTQFSTFKIPVPPTLEEQQEIVDVLDAASEIIRLRTACIESAQSLIPALFQEMFGDPINNDKNLPKEKIRKIFTLTSGKFIPSKELDSNGQYPVYGGNGINGYHNEFLFEDSKICIGRVGVKCGCIHRTEPHSWITDNALYIDNYLIPINETYLKEALTQINLNQYAKRAAQPVISQTTICNQYLLLPPEDQQELFAAKVQEIEAYIKIQQAELEKAQTMFNSLLHHAFTGKLTENITFEVENE